MYTCMHHPCGQQLYNCELLQFSSCLIINITQKYTINPITIYHNMKDRNVIKWEHLIFDSCYTYARSTLPYRSCEEGTCFPPLHPLWQPGDNHEGNSDHLSWRDLSTVWYSALVLPDAHDSLCGKENRERMKLLKYTFTSKLTDSKSAMLLRSTILDTITFYLTKCKIMFLP
jgi:hypothetical protein